MKEFKFHIPVNGMIHVPIVAESLEQAIQIVIDKKEQLEHHPMGQLELLLDQVLAMDPEPKIVS